MGPFTKRWENRVNEPGCPPQGEVLTINGVTFARRPHRTRDQVTFSTTWVSRDPRLKAYLALVKDPFGHLEEPMDPSQNTVLFWLQLAVA